MSSEWDRKPPESFEQRPDLCDICFKRNILTALCRKKNWKESRAEKGFQSADSHNHPVKGNLWWLVPEWWQWAWWNVVAFWINILQVKPSGFADRSDVQYKRESSRHKDMASSVSSVKSQVPLDAPIALYIRHNLVAGFRWQILQ